MSDSKASSRSTPVDLWFDLFVYAPLGFALEAPRLLPELADKGRNHVNTARAVGQFAAQMLERRVGPAGGVLGAVIGGLGLRGSAPVKVADPPRADPRPTGSAASSSTQKPATGTDSASAPSPPGDAEDLPIAEYDSLAASQVVPRLVGLTPAELSAVQAYEQAGRARRTVLNRVAQLLGEPKGPSA